MKTKHILFYVVFLLSSVSCNKILNTEVEDFLTTENYFQTEDQLNLALTGVYDNLGSSDLYANAMLGRMAIDSDEGFYTGSQRTGVFVNAATPADPDVLKFWAACYRGISRANLLLDNINKPTMDETKRNIIKGQALLLRSHFYLLLISNFGGVPMIFKPVESSFDTQLAATPAKEGYEMILKDMEEAATLVESATSVGFGGRISKSAVWGEMARVCLYMAGNPVNDNSKYAEARKWAKMIIDSKEHDLNTSYSQIFINQAKNVYDIKESIWEVEFDGNGTDAFRETSKVGSNNGIKSKDADLGIANGFINTTGRLYRRYLANDLRRDHAIAPFYLSGDPAVKKNWSATSIYDRSCGKWRREYETLLPRTGNTPQNFPLLRYSDVLLMFAEADNEVNNGPTAEAYEAVNQVRRRGYGKAVKTPHATIDLKNLNKTTFLAELQDERSRELCFECLRKYDLVRWGIYVTNMKKVATDFKVDAIKETWLEFSIGFDNVLERNTRWPIPERELRLNKLLKQNDIW